MIEGLSGTIKADSARATKVNCTESVEEYVNKSDWRINANSNTGYSHAGLINNLAGKVIANFWLDKVYSKAEGDAHRNGDYHIHDLDQLAAYCCGHDLQKLLDEGFNGVPGRVSSRAPKHFREALYQMANFIGILQAEWAGAQAFSSFDTYLAPLCFFDMQCNGLSESDIKKAIRNFIYNLNVPSRWGQSPFSNVTIDWTVPEVLKDKVPTRNGENFFISIIKECDKASDGCKKMYNEIKKRLGDLACDDPELNMMGVTYSLFQNEMNIINKCFYEVLNEGDENEQPFTFPIPTINITEDFDWYGENTDILFQNAAKYGSSYFQNFIGSQYITDENGNKVRDPQAYSPKDIRSMCPLTADTQLVVKSNKGISIQPIANIVKNINNSNRNQSASNEVFYNGNWYKFIPIDVDNQDVYEIFLSNGLSVKMGEYHLQPTLENGTIIAKNITAGDWLPFNRTPITCFEDRGSYELGYAIGAYLGDGSQIYSSGGNGICYSLSNNEKDDKTVEILSDFWKKLGFNVSIIIDNNLRTCKIGANSYELIARYIEGDNALNKGMSYKLFSLSQEARQGVIDGYIATDGLRISKRISTSSRRMVDDLIALFNMQGQKGCLSTYIDTRTNRLGDNPNYIISHPSRENYGEKFKTVDGFTYYKVVAVKKIEREKLYCIAVDSDEHLFTLANGLITHNCRLQLDLSLLRRKGGGLFGSDAQTGSVGVVTINCARLGYLNKGDKKSLYKSLDKLLGMAKSTLEKKRKVVTEFYDRGLYPYTRRYLLNKFDSFFSTIGVNGMNEMVRNFTNDKENITTEYGQKMTIEMLDYIREQLTKWQKETGNLYNLEATPAEGTTYRFAKEDIKRYGTDIIHAGTEEQPYYTNSSQLPVNYSSDAFEVLDLQDELQKKYTGGTVLHLYMSEPISSPETCRQLIRKVISNYRLPYISISPVYAICPIHGYIGGHHEYCPKCDRELMNKHAEEIDFNS